MRIAEVVEKYGVSADTLRYYERIGLLPHVTRTVSGIRDYSEVDCSRISFIKCMRQANVSIEALTTYMQLLDQGDDTIAERKALLEEQRSLVRQRISEMQAGLERLDYKIEHYEDLIVQAEQDMRGHQDG